MKHVFKTTQTFVFLLVAIGLTSIGGCLVSESDPPRLIPRNIGKIPGIDVFDSLRTITGGEFFDYTVFGQVTSIGGGSTSFQGTLHVEYTITTLADPFGAPGVISPVIREDSILMLGAAPFTLRRYLQQDSMTGALSVLAVEVSGPTTLYRAGNAVNAPQAVEIIPSPVPSTGSATITFDYMQGCESTPPCSGIAQSINKSITYQGDADITTNDGRFLALRLDYSGGFTNGSAPALFDLLGACDEDSAAFYGSSYIFPEVGIVYMDHSCTALNGASSHNYRASLSNTNVVIP